ncbi:restriction endonuclease subunit S [Aestuariirhabdus sp. Z084]|uniref:restriction endonuclease subunit S n=1 Tax=Aestuariirhabdus haliotis TaxID=2918751 RepID=UPI00201B4283|nr:restriction endonuclease subunit S [Aestuariirhabdus haliotis]MCL6415513.1 restriction endonuclease subunit S [Aestuariirhabdus haliotis]MCL6419282.1 restriction endonuclease subunit S [Aestuariirhabdus haliotis]
MTGKYQAYPEYKNTGVEWLGELPVDWGITKLKYTASIFGRIGFRGYTVNDIVDEGEGAIVLSPSNIDEDHFTLEKKTYLSWEKYYESPEIMVADGDILMVKTGSTFGKSTIVKNVDEPMTINPQMALFKESNLDSRYLSYLLNSTLIKAKIDVSNTGSGMPTMTQENMNSFPVPRPKDELATHIANFLDHETAKIDTLIEKQQQLIKLLKEKRQAVISHAVTKGLNPNAPMRNSGVEWLGEVPEHWAMPKISHVGRVLNGSTPDKSNLSYWEGGIVPWLASGCLNSEIVDEPSHLISEAAYQSCSVELIPSDSLLVGMVGQGKTRGTSAILAIDSCINQNMAAIIPNEKVEIRFLYFLFQAMYDDLRELGRGGNQAALNCEIISSIRIPLPPIEEQKAIVDMLDELLIKLSDTDSLGEEQITLLQERRTALISATVTGKIDVRNWVAPSHPCDRDISASMHVTTPEQQIIETKT